MGEDFRWNDWNLSHIARHGIDCDGAEYVVLHAQRPYPSYEGDGRWLVRGQTSGGQYLQVVYILDPPEQQTLYIIHARSLSDREKRNFRKRRR